MNSSLANMLRFPFNACKYLYHELQCIFMHILSNVIFSKINDNNNQFSLEFI